MSLLITLFSFRFLYDDVDDNKDNDDDDDNNDDKMAVALEGGSGSTRSLTLSCPRSQKSFVIHVCLVNLLVKLSCQISHTAHFQ